MVGPLLDFVALASVVLRVGLRVQKLRLNMGRRTGMLTVKIPTMVSRTPQRLMLRAEGLPETVRITRMRAAAMTKIPEERRRLMTSFLGRCQHCVRLECEGAILLERHLKLPEQRQRNTKNQGIGTVNLELVLLSL
jgi:hypothetical protein